MIRILHLDDSQDDCELVSFHLQRLDEDLVIDAVQSTPEAAKLLRERAYDCILCDFQLGKANGLQFLKKVKENDLETSFIFLTGQGSEEIAAEALRAGADDYFTKEVGFAHYQRLVNSIRRVVETSSVHKARKQAERALKSSEARYRSLFESSKDVVYISTPAGRIIDMNPSGAALFGYSREELLELNVEQLYADPAHRADFKRGIERAGFVKDYPLKLKSKSGDIIHVLITSTVQRDSDGNIIGYQGIIRDISERKLAAEELALTQALLMAAIEQSPAGILVADAPDGNIRLANSAAKAILGESDIPLNGVPLERHPLRQRTFHADGTPFTIEELPLTQAVVHGRISTNVDAVIRRADGTHRWVLSNAAPVRNGKGEVIAGIYVFSDVSERRAFEERLRFTQFSIDRSGEAAIWLSEQGRVVYVNEATCRSMGCTREELLGMTIHDIDPTFPPERWPEHLQEVRERGSFLIESVHRAKNGREFPVEITVNHLEFEGREYNCAFVRDITERKLAESALRDSEEKFRELFHNINDAIFLWELDDDGSLGRCLEVNDVACHLSEYSRSEMLDMLPANMNDADFVERLPDILRRLIHERHVTFSNVLITKSGRCIPVEVNNHLFRFRGRDVILSVTRDVSERIEMERELRFKYFTIGNMGDAAYWIMRDGKLMDVNAAACNYLGYSRDELLGRSIFDIETRYKPEMWDRAWESIKRHRVLTVESEHRRKNGERLPVEIVANYLEFEGMEYVCAFARDITERRRSESVRDAIYRISEASHTAGGLDELFALIHDVLSDMFHIENFYIALFDADRQMLSFPYFIDQHEEAPAPYKLGRGLTEYVLRTGKPLLASPETVVELESEGEVELVGPPSVDWLGVPLQVRDKTIGVLGVQSYSEKIRYGEEEKRMLEFVSAQVAMAIERKKAEDALVASRDQLVLANRELESFSYSVSHDLRAPLRVIDGMSRVLLERKAGELGAEGQHFIARMVENTGRMYNLIDGLLDLSRLSQQELRREDVDISSLAAEIGGNLKLEAPEREVEFIVAAGITLNADKSLMRNALENLLRNAWKFTGKEKSARIELGCRQGEEGESIIFIRDNGIGFEPEHADSLFIPFKRLQAETEFEGTGIGLATVKRIVERHGGRVWAEGNPGEGAEFSFSL